MYWKKAKHYDSACALVSSTIYKHVYLYLFRANITILIEPARVTTCYHLPPLQPDLSTQ